MLKIYAPPFFGHTYPTKRNTIVNFKIECCINRRSHCHLYRLYYDNNDEIALGNQKKNQNNKTSLRRKPILMLF